jgi:hypothetical protein
MGVFVTVQGWHKRRWSADAGDAYDGWSKGVVGD